MNKIFIGLVDIASFIADWNEGFKKNNIDTLTGSIAYQPSVQNSKVHFVIQKTQDKIRYFKPGRISVRLKPWWNKTVKNYYFNKAVRECDVFLFIWSSFKDDFSDYKYLKEKGKKIITLFVGSDVRWPYSMKQDFQLHNISVVEDYHYDHTDYSIIDLERCLRCLRMAEKYSDLILGQPNYMQLALKPYNNINIPIILDSFKNKQTQRKIPLLVHAPTSTIKGTKFIEEAVARLSREGMLFEYKRIQNMPRAEALEVYSNADIVLDQLLLPGGGKLAYECLAMGKIVLTAMDYTNYDQKKPSDCPLVDVNPDTLYDVLKKIILDYDGRVELATKGRPYILEHHNPKTIVKKVIDLLNSSNQQTFDFKPTFFRDKFIPESEDAINMYNKWTDVVKDCDWYKEEIITGNRAGLKF